MIEREVTIGSCRLIQGDCQKVLPLLNHVDTVITSPPYNCGMDYGISGDEMDIDEYWSWLEEIMFLAMGRVCWSGYLCINHANFIGSRELRAYVPDELHAILSRVGPFVDHIIWDKGPANGAAWGNYPTSPRIRAQHENIWIHGGVNKMRDSDITWSEWSQFTTSIWRIPTAGIDLNIHPAMMPVEVARRLCLLYSPAAGWVLDPFMGSGTTGVASIVTNRAFIGIEKDPAFFDVAIKRIQQAWQLKCSELPFDDEPKLKQRELI